MRRDRLTIWLDILHAVQTMGPREVPSRIQARANLPHDRFWRHVEEMSDRGLLQPEPLRTTSAGEEFLTANAALRVILGDLHPDPADEVVHGGIAPSLNPATDRRALVP